MEFIIDKLDSGLFQCLKLVTSYDDDKKMRIGLKTNQSNDDFAIELFRT